MKKIICTGISLLLCTVLLNSVCQAVVPNASNEFQNAQVVNAQMRQEADYAQYINSFSYKNAEKPVSVDPAYVIMQNNASVTSEDTDVCGSAYPLEKGSSAVFNITVPSDSLYTIAVKFGNISSSAQEYDLSLQIDGDYSFYGCTKLKLNPLWEDDGVIRQISNGDEVNPAQKQKACVNSQLLYDADGLVTEPFRFAMSAGEHTLTLKCLNEAFYICSIELNVPQKPGKYADVSSDYKKSDYYKGKQLVIEAERPIYKNAYDLIARSDNGSADISPNNPKHSVLNYIGGATWCEPGQEITWEIEVPETGLYKIGFSFKQSGVNNGTVYRTLKIDGKVPFDEATNIGFDYATKWQVTSVKDKSGENCLFRLEKGKHIISLSVTLSDIANVYQKLNEIVIPLGNLYLDMAMITGENPDINRDYELHKQIPEFTETLESIKNNCDDLYQKIDTSLKANGELRGALKNMSRILNNMQQDLYEAHLQIPTYYTAYQTLSSWLNDLKNMPLNLDKIIIAAPDKPYESTLSGFFDRIKFGLLRFIYSYSSGYSNVSMKDDDSLPTIKIWVNWGRDQVKVLNSLIQDSFVSKNKINVAVEQVNATLVQGVVSGNSPDLYLQMARTEPVNLAMRGVLYDLKNFSDYEQVLDNFMDNAEVPYLYRGGCYALPDLQSFYVMFCRKDILDELGISIPNTWDEFLVATGLLQRNNMNTYLPYTKITAATTVNTGAGGLSIFPTMLLQRGGSVYNDDITASCLASTASVQAFSFWTDFYTKYSLEQDANFYQKFRVGTIPIGIAAYTQYLTFAAAAPEIDGKWIISPIPGVVDENGTVNRLCSGSGTGCSIMKSSKNKDAAWEFLKWWVSSETQYRYSSENEAILGETGRISTSNVEAVSRLSWNRESLEVIMEQWKSVSEIPEAPGSYFVSRSIDQAFWAVKNKKSSPKKAITDWTEICDEEIRRKIEEYSVKEK